MCGKRIIYIKFDDNIRLYIVCSFLAILFGRYFKIFLIYPVFEIPGAKSRMWNIRSKISHFDASIHGNFDIPTVANIFTDPGDLYVYDHRDSCKVKRRGSTYANESIGESPFAL